MSFLLDLLTETSSSQGKELQTGFQAGMEDILGVKEDISKFRSHENWVESREDVTKADALEANSEDRTRARYQRMFWEPTVENDVCIYFFSTFCYPGELLSTLLRSTGSHRARHS